jgi:hypothetical protein
MLTKTQIVALIQAADRHGSAYALQLLNEGASQEGYLDTLAAIEEDAHGDYEDRWGLSEDDTVDIHGAPLRPRVNDAGEPFWM